VRYRILACDYDRTIAFNGVVPHPVLRLLWDVKRSGRRLVLVTGRTLDELTAVFHDLPMFDALVIENGAVLRVGDAEELLGPALPPQLVDALEAREVEPLAIGSVICATAEPNRTDVVEALVATRLERDLVLNRDSIMVLPPGIDKWTGLQAALRALGEPVGTVVAVGDGENDLPLIARAGAGVAVENAVSELKERADVVLAEPGVDGLRRLATSLTEHDMADLLPEARKGRAV